MLLKLITEAITVLPSTPSAPTAPAAPMNGKVNDVTKEWQLTVNPLYPNSLQYKINGLPGTTGPVYLSAANSYQVGDTLYVKVGSAVLKGGLAIYVAGSGNVPDGAVLTNAEPFTGVAQAPTPTPGPALTAALAISVASIVAGNSLTFEVTAGGGTAPYAYAVKATNNATGAVTILGSSATGSFTPQTGGTSYNIDATVTDAAGNTKPAQTRTVQVTAAQSVNQLPVASAGDDLTITAPTSSVALMGTASDPDPGDTLTYLWRPIAGPNTPVGLPATTLNVVVSNLLPGTYQFGFQATDQKGGKSTEDFVVVNVNAPSGGGSKPPLFLVVGNSIQAYGWTDAGGQIGGPTDESTAPRNRPGDFMFARSTNAGAKFIALADPGRSWREWITEGATLPDGSDNYYKRNYASVFNKYKDTYRIITILAYGENGFDRNTHIQQVQYATTAINYMKSVGATEFVMMPTVNRTDSSGGTTDPNWPYLAAKNYYDQYWIDNASALGLKIAPKASAPLVYADNYPNDTARCFDKVHPTLLGNKEMSWTMVDGLKLLPNLTFAPLNNSTPNPTPTPNPSPSAPSTFAQWEPLPGTTSAADYSKDVQILDKYISANVADGSWNKGGYNKYNGLDISKADSTGYIGRLRIKGVIPGSTPNADQPINSGIVVLQVNRTGPVSIYEADWGAYIDFNGSRGWQSAPLSKIARNDQETWVDFYTDHVEFRATAETGEVRERFSKALPASGIISAELHFIRIGQGMANMEFEGPGLVAL